MHSKKSQSSFQDNDSWDHNNSKDYWTLAELMKEQGVSTDLSDYWEKECELNPSDPSGLVYDD